MPSLNSPNAVVQNSNSSAQQDALILYVIEQLNNQVVNCTKINMENKSANDTLTAELERYKEQIKLLKEGQNVDLTSKAQQLEPKLYVGDIIEKTNPIVIPDSEETLLLAEESRSKMLLKQKGSHNVRKEVNTNTRALGLRIGVEDMRSQEPILLLDPTIVEVPKELPKVNMVNTSLKKLKHHLAGYDVVVKERTTPTTITKGKVFSNIGYIWRPTGRTFTIVRNAFPLTRITTTTEVPLRKQPALENETPKPVVTLVYSRKPRKSKTNVPVVQIVLWYLDSGCSKHMTGDRSQLTNFVNKFLGTVKFRNDHVAKILGYGDYHIGNVTISKVITWKDLDKPYSPYDGVLSNMSLVKGLKDEVVVVAPTPVSSELCKKKPHKPKSEDTNQEKLYLLHMDLCGPMRIAIQNGVVERRNHTLIEAARTMLIYAKASLFLWAEVVATACYTQNRSSIRLRHGKTPYELLHDKLPDLLFFHVFGALCYPTNDSENLGKLQPKADIGIFIGYAPTKKAFRIYNRRTRRIIKTIHVDFDELTAMASEHSSLEPALHEMTLATISSGLIPNPPPSIWNIQRRTRRYNQNNSCSFDELTVMASEHSSLGPHSTLLK
ncbi:retrovirus-related pol polyprotein from transposon TNT 1-94 [Tanacetum coccineum]